MRVLILDRDPLVRRALLRLLSIDGHDVITTESAAQAIGILAHMALDRDADFDVAVLDLDAVDGARLAAQIAVAGSPRLIFLSAYAERADAARKLGGVLVDKMDLARVREAI